MRVLENHQDRIGTRQRFNLRSQGFQRLLSPSLGGQFEIWVASIVRDLPIPGSPVSNTT
jgi:hypothetical protein